MFTFRFYIKCEGERWGREGRDRDSDRLRQREKEHTHTHTHTHTHNLVVDLFKNL